MIENKKQKRKKNDLQKETVPMLSIKTISEKYGFHPQTVRNWINRDGLRRVEHGPGGKVFIKQDDVEAFIKKWYESDEFKGIIGMVVPCRWLGCKEHAEIDYTVKGRPDYLPDGWERLVISKGFLADKVMPAAHIDGWLCPKHYQELLRLLKKVESNEQDKDKAHGIQ